MNYQQSSIKAAKELINNNPNLFNKFADKELQVTIIASAMLQFSIDCDKTLREENRVPELFEDIFKSFNFSL